MRLRILIGKPDRFARLNISPDGKHLLTPIIERLYSYGVLLRSFPQSIDVRNLSGKVIHTVAKLPPEEPLPPGNDAVRTGVRDIRWRADAPATLVWAEAQDGGVPAIPMEIRDLVLMHAAPFKDKPRDLMKLASRYQDAIWARGDRALITEFWCKTRMDEAGNHRLLIAADNESIFSMAKAHRRKVTSRLLIASISTAKRKSASFNPTRQYLKA